MKHFLPVLGVMLLAAGCTKTNNLSTNDLLGKWDLTEAANIPAPGASPEWFPIALGMNFEFKPAHQYFSYSSAGIVYSECTGTYTLTSDSLLILQSPCMRGPDTTKLVSINGDFMVVQRPVHPSTLFPSNLSKYRRR